MGSAIAEAGAVAQGYFNDRHQEESENTKLREMNRKLQEQLGQKYLRPVVGGIFGGGDRPLGGTPVVGNTVVESPRPLARGVDPTVYDERPPVTVYNPLSQKFTGISASHAEQLKLQKGDWLMGEHFEAMGGEPYGNLVSLTGIANEPLGGTDLFDNAQVPGGKWRSPEWSVSEPPPPLKLNFGYKPRHSSGRM